MGRVTYLIFLILLFVGCQKTKSKQENVEISKTKHDTYLDIPIDTLLNSDTYLILGNKNAQIKIVSKNNTSNYIEYKLIDSIGDICFLGKNLDEKTLEIYEKFKPKASFSDYEVKIYSGKLKAPDFNSYPWAKKYITAIKEECNKGINFAGKYTLVIWGCGSPCQDGVIVDRTNGKIYKGYFSSLGSEFKKDSQLIIFNSGLINTETQLMILHKITKVYSAIWNGTEFLKL